MMKKRRMMFARTVRRVRVIMVKLWKIIGDYMRRVRHPIEYALGESDIGSVTFLVLVLGLLLIAIGVYYHYYLIAIIGAALGGISVVMLTFCGRLLRWR